MGFEKVLHLFRFVLNCLFMKASDDKAEAGVRGAAPGQAAGTLLFTHLRESEEFAEFALILKHLTGLSMALNTPDVGLTCIGVAGDTGNPVCRMIRGTPEGQRRCEACDRRQHGRAAAAGKPFLYTCHAGFYDIAVPVLVQDEHVATISSGQVLREAPSDDGFAALRKRLNWLDVSTERLRKAYDRAPWIPREQLRHVMRLVEIFTRQMCDSSWRIRELEASLGHPSIARARAYIEANFRDPRLQLADVAAAVDLSTAHLSHLFHQEVGVTFTSYVQSRRITEAKHLLRHTGRSVTGICFACGFNSLTHFNRVFRKGEGCSPSQYRQHQ
jgi:AraC-like DNA-binding protein/ligand-binding sensor protein